MTWLDIEPLNECAERCRVAMPTLQQQIADKFLASLSDSKALEDAKIERLRLLLVGCKKLKPDELVKLFTEPAADDVK